MIMNSREKRLESFGRLLDIMDELREKCPWDREQTFESLRNLTIEETYELADAILLHDINGMREELGDLLLHIVFYAKIASEIDAFDIADVVLSLSEKLILRHPHVFSHIQVRNSTDVKENWEEIKMKGEHISSVLGGVPKSLPAMIKASRIQEKVQAIGFDWEKRHQIWGKIEEEKNELLEAIEDGKKERIEDEFGDLFFSIINAARLYDIDPETALEKTNIKFTNRFKYIEREIRKSGKNLKNMKLDEMNEIWEKAKESEDQIKDSE